MPLKPIWVGKFPCTTTTTNSQCVFSVFTVIFLVFSSTTTKLETKNLRTLSQHTTEHYTNTIALFLSIAQFDTKIHCCCCRFFGGKTLLFLVGKFYAAFSLTLSLFLSLSRVLCSIATNKQNCNYIFRLTPKEFMLFSMFLCLSIEFKA